MKIRKIADILSATVYAKDDWLDREVATACGSDMMSEVLAFAHDQSILLTGLVNPQTIRTAHMMDMYCVVFVRGKKPTEEMRRLAYDSGITVMETGSTMFEACGLLYTAGLGATR